MLLALVLASAPTLQPARVLGSSPLPPRCEGCRLAVDARHLYLQHDGVGLQRLALDSRAPPEPLCSDPVEPGEVDECPGPFIGLAGRALVFAADGRIVVVDPKRPHEFPVDADASAFGTDGQRLVWVQSGDALTVYDVGGRTVARLDAPSASLERVWMAAGVVTIATSDGVVWRRTLAGSWQRLRATEEPAVLSGDGRRALLLSSGAAVLDERGAVLWSVGGDAERAEFSADRRLLALSGPGGAQVREADTGRVVLQSDGAVTAVKLSGQSVVAGFASGAVKAWNGLGQRSDFGPPSSFGPVTQLLPLGGGGWLSVHGLEVVRWSAAHRRDARAWYSPPPLPPFWATSHACAGMSMGDPGVCDAVWSARLGGPARARQLYRRWRAVAKRPEAWRSPDPQATLPLSFEAFVAPAPPAWSTSDGALLLATTHTGGEEPEEFPAWLRPVATPPVRLEARLLCTVRAPELGPASATDDAVELWSPEQTLRRRIQLPAAPRSCDVSADGTVLVADADGLLQVSPDGARARGPGAEGAVRLIAPGRVLALADGRVTTRALDGADRRDLALGEELPVSFDVSRDGHLAAVGTFTGKILLFDLR